MDEKDRERLEFELSEYLDGHLDPSEEPEFRRQLEADADLREDLRLYSALNDHLAKMGQADLGVDEELQRSSIMAALERKALLSARPRRFTVIKVAFGGLAAAAAVLLIVTVANFFKQGGPTSIALNPTPTPKPSHAQPKGSAVIDVAFVPPHKAHAGAPLILSEMEQVDLTEIPADGLTPTADDGGTTPVLATGGGSSTGSSSPELFYDVMAQ